MIHLANNYYLDADQYTFVITERRLYKTGKRKGEEIFAGLEYHTTLKAVFRAVNELLARRGVEARWSKKVAINEYLALNRALEKVTAPDFTKSFFSMKKEYVKND